LEKVHTYGSTKDWTFVGAEKILKRAREVVRLLENNKGRSSGRRRVNANWNNPYVFRAK
jgi:hypothetical protein